MYSPAFETEVLRVLSALKAKKEQIEAQYKTDLAAIDNEIGAVMTTARLLRQSPLEPLSSARVTVIPTIAGKTIQEGCMEIARNNNGVVLVKEAKDALIKAGILRKTKNSWGIVNTTLSRSKNFSKHESVHGAYRLIASQGELSAAS